MTKYGRGLGREVVGAVNCGELPEVFDVAVVREFAGQRGWNPPDSYLRVVLGNAAPNDHSPGYAKYFERVDEGHYRVRDEFRGPFWR